ncbi:MAG: YdcF family protein [Cyanobacteria bacterium SID2]|nr:YdcF family protein [Cyanobacteria bacterium SID2]MBP0005127.1 YdcF family protein [Cyanobacteria bacterium SBC]
MFLVLTRLLLWLLILVIAVFIVLKILPKTYFTFLGWLVMVVFVLLIFIDPADRTATIAWYILSLPFKPIGIVGLLLLFGLQGIKKDSISKAARNQFFAAFILLVFFSMPLFPELAYHRSIERNAIELLEKTAEDSADTIVLPAQNTVEPNIFDRTQIQLTENGNLIRYAAQLYFDLGTVSRIIVSAGQYYDIPTLEDDAPLPSEAEIVRDLLIGFGVPDTDIVIPDRSAQNLRETSLAVSDFLTDLNVSPQRVLIVTPALSMYRALTTLANVGIQGIPRPTSFLAFEPSNPERFEISVQSFVPSAAGLMLSTQLVDEYLATIYYFLRGWLAPAEFTCLECQQAKIPSSETTSISTILNTRSSDRSFSLSSLRVK